MAFTLGTSSRKIPYFSLGGFFMRFHYLQGQKCGKVMVSQKSAHFNNELG
jgi:hypothetical protein